MRNLRCALLSVAAMLLFPAVSFSHTFQVDTLINADGGGPNDVSVGYDNIGLAYDSLGNLGMCYYDARNSDLKFALNDGNAWTFETAHADPGGDSVGSYCAIVFDDDDNPNIVYFNTTDSAILHAEKVGGRWTIRTVETPVGVDMFGVNRVSLAKDGLGDLGVAYYDRNGQDLKYAKFSNNRWTVSVVRNAGNVGRYASLDFDSRNRPAIAYQDYTDMSAASLKFIAHNGNAWMAPETVDGTNYAGSYLSFKFDPSNKPHIIYRHVDQAQQFYQVFYINKIGAGWSERFALAQDSGPATGFYCQMVIDDSGAAHMCYMDSFFSALFPDANYLKCTSLYFTNRGITGMSQINDRLAVSVIPMLNYQGTAMAVHNLPANNNNPQLKQLTVAWAQDSGRDYDLVTARLTNWSPVMAITSPNANTHTGRDTFNVEWLDDDPDHNATISFERLDANWVSVPLRETAREDDANTVALDISQVPRGDYRITSRIFDVDPGRPNGGWSPELLTVENHFPSSPNLAGPADRAVVDIATPTLQWGASTDVDNDAITYQVQVATDDAFANVIASGNNVANAQWAPADALGNNAIYHWRVRAVDSEGGEGQWTAGRQFSTNIPVVAAAAGGNNAAGGGNAPAGGGNNANAGGGNNANAGGGNAPAGGGHNAAGAGGGPVIGGGNAPVGAGAGHAAGAGAAAAGAGGGGGGGAGGVPAGAAGGGSAAPSNASPAKSGCSLIREQ